jgi:hypothetical protein
MRGPEASKDWWLPCLYVLAAVWAILPPTLLWVEYHQVLLRDPKFVGERFDGYKYGVDLGLKIWLAVYTVLALFLASEFFKRQAQDWLDHARKQAQGAPPNGQEANSSAQPGLANQTAASESQSKATEAKTDTTATAKAPKK